MNSHENRISDEDIEKMGGKILSEFFCKTCEFVTDNQVNLDTHVDNIHEPFSKQRVYVQDFHQGA